MTDMRMERDSIGDFEIPAQHIRDVVLAEGLMTEAQLAEAFATDNLLGIRH